MTTQVDEMQAKASICAGGRQEPVYQGWNSASAPVDANALAHIALPGVKCMQQRVQPG